MTASIDWTFIAQLDGAAIKNGYVPNPDTSKSGVTIATGFDLGQRTRVEIARWISHRTNAPANLPTRAVQNLRNLEEIRAFPLGWTKSHGRPNYNWHRSVAGWIKKVVGLAVTAFALSLGAPFWFDMLSSFVRIRGSGDPPVLSVRASQIQMAPQLRIVPQTDETPQPAVDPAVAPQPAELAARHAS